MNYRNFDIDPHWYEGFVYAHQDYDGAPDANDSRVGREKTIEACKLAIDEYYAEKTIYAVRHSEVLAQAKFYFIDEAISFCRFWGIDPTNITWYVGNWEHEFDSI
jgi:hypothetical protein